MDKLIWMDARTHKQTLNSHFDNYVEPSASKLDKTSLTTKRNTSKHKQDTMLITKFEITTLVTYLNLHFLRKSIHVYRSYTQK
jgi:hypothetical protein